MIERLKAISGLLLVLAMMLVAGIAAGATLVSAQSHEESDDQKLTPRAGSHRLSERAAIDPRGEEGWRVRRYTGTTGLDCYEVGQIVGGDFGNRVAGRFRAWPLDEPTGLCGDLATSRDGAMVSAMGRGTGEGTNIDRTVVYGIAEPRIKHLTVTTPAGETQQAAVDGRGTFAASFAGEQHLSAMTITYTYRDGRRARLKP
jgi:hypothetical protein